MQCVPPLLVGKCIEIPGSIPVTSCHRHMLAVADIRTQAGRIPRRQAGINRRCAKAAAHQSSHSLLQYECAACCCFSGLLRRVHLPSLRHSSHRVDAAMNKKSSTVQKSYDGVQLHGAICSFLAGPRGRCGPVCQPVQIQQHRAPLAGVRRSHMCDDARRNNTRGQVLSISLEADTHVFHACLTQCRWYAVRIRILPEAASFVCIPHTVIHVSGRLCVPRECADCRASSRASQGAQSSMKHGVPDHSARLAACPPPTPGNCGGTTLRRGPKRGGREPQPGLGRG